MVLVLIIFDIVGRAHSQPLVIMECMGSLSWRNTYIYEFCESFIKPYVRVVSLISKMLQVH